MNEDGNASVRSPIEMSSSVDTRKVRDAEVTVVTQHCLEFTLSFYHVLLVLYFVYGYFCVKGNYVS